MNVMFMNWGSRSQDLLTNILIAGVPFLLLKMYNLYPNPVSFSTHWGTAKLMLITQKKYLVDAVISYRYLYIVHCKQTYRKSFVVSFINGLRITSSSISNGSLIGCVCGCIIIISKNVEAMRHPEDQDYAAHEDPQQHHVQFNGKELLGVLLDNKVFFSKVRWQDRSIDNIALQDRGPSYGPKPVLRLLGICTPELHGCRKLSDPFISTRKMVHHEELRQGKQ